ncbi:pseudouridine synthase [Azospirillum lipoferum]|uniref:Pseudouridine synthase n=1 Tax=Azospirillum lipoferum (strain 4B) TaxID=862719 RepID=G7Z1R2_AZOL4|nr:pseudouridine synthase [Azospirillum lipoferum]CBS87195.1 Pseudouridine synthase [Azospirillum lipoferum 4B]
MDRSDTAKKSDSATNGGERIAKRLARAGLCSRRDAERWIAEGRVAVNSRVLDSPACVVRPGDIVQVDGKVIPEPEPARLWRYHKPSGLVTTARDEKGRETVFDRLPADLPRVVSIGRLDLTTEGLLLLTNDGELARFLELPATGWTRRYRVRVFGEVDERQLAALEKGPTIEGVKYGPIEAVLDRIQGRNAWLTVSLKEGKNREIRKVMESLGLQVNRLIRVAYGPFQLGKLEEGAVEEVPKRVVREQIAPFFGTPEGAEPAESGTKQRAKARADAAVKSAPAKSAPAKSAPGKTVAAKADAKAAPKRAPRSATKRHEAEAARVEETKPARRGTLSLSKSGPAAAKSGRPGKPEGRDAAKPAGAAGPRGAKPGGFKAGAAKSDGPRSEGARSEGARSRDAKPRDDKPRDAKFAAPKSAASRSAGPKAAGSAPKGGPKAGGDRSGGGAGGRTERPRADRRR